MKQSAAWLLVVMAGVVVAQPPVGEKQRDRLRMISQTLSGEVPLVIAHRGASGYLPEHTTEAAAFAHALGADFIEQDVVLSKDGTAVVLHDVTLNNVTNVAQVFPGRDREGKFYVFDFTLEELKSLNVNERVAEESRRRFPRDVGRFRIATLEEHIQLIQGLNRSRGREAGVYVEIKQPALHREENLDPAAEVLRILARYGYQDADDRAFIQCFEEPEVLRMRTELKCRLPLIQLLSKPPSGEQLADIARVADGIGVPITSVVKGADNGQPDCTNLVAAAHQHALMIHVWTFRTDDLPDFAESSEALLNWLARDAGVDGIFTDQPDAVLSWRTAAQARGGKQGPFHLLQGGRRQP